MKEMIFMFSVQKCPKSHEIYIYYNEYLNEDADESILVLEHLNFGSDINNYVGLIDLVTVKSLSDTEVIKLKKMHDILVDSNINSITVISDNNSILRNIKSLIPDVSIKLFKKH